MTSTCNEAVSSKEDTDSKNLISADITPSKNPKPPNDPAQEEADQSLGDIISLQSKETPVKGSLLRKVRDESHSLSQQLSNQDLNTGDCSSMDEEDQFGLLSQKS